MVQRERYPAPVFQQEPGVSPYTIEFSGLDRSPCPVCRNSTGDCVGDEHDPNSFHMMEFKQAEKPDPAATFIVQARVFTEQQVGKRTVRELLYAVGDRIRPEEAKRVGLIP